MLHKTKNLWLILLLIVAANLMGGSIVSAQDEDARRLWDGAFLKKRAEAKTPAPARKTTAYRRTTPKKTAAQSPASQSPTSQNPASQNSAAQNRETKADGELVGLTIWRLRTSRATDKEETRLLLEDESNKEWTPERVEADTVFTAGDRVRLGIESPRDGYLYVIDREQYTDGTFSDPYLIFPSLRNRDGANSVAAGKLIELPDRAAFRLKPMRADYAGEVLTVLVTSEPLTDVKPESGPVKLDSKTVAQWETQWAGAVERFELIGGVGKPYTKAEKEAGQDGARILTQDDVMPQTLYHVSGKPGAPLLVTVPLRIGK